MQQQRLGLILGVLSGVLWGCMDIAAQYLLHESGMKAPEFISLTMSVGAISLLGWNFLFAPGKTLNALKEPRNVASLAVFGILILGAEATFFSCIQFSNATTAAILACTRPFWIIGLLTLVAVWPTRRQVLCAALAVFGVILVVTKGHFGDVSFSLTADICGLGAAIFSACYTLQSQRVISQVGSLITLGWGMLFGSLLSNFYHPFWNTEIVWTPLCVFAVLWVAIVGHILAYACYLLSAGKISPSVTGVLETVEPLTAVVLSMIIFGAVLSAPMLIGGFCILTAVILLSRDSRTSQIS